MASRVSKPGVSVIIPCYKQAHLLSYAIESVLSHKKIRTELIVVDDGSPDNVAAVTERYRGNVIYVRQPNSGLSAARNAGIRHAGGELVLFLDADDFLFDNTLDAYVHVADKYPSAHVFCGGFRTVYADCTVLQEYQARPIPADPFHYLLKNCNQWPVHAIAVRRHKLLEAGGFDNALKSMEDWDMWLRMASLGFNFVKVPIISAAYRQLPDSMSTNGTRMWRSGLTVLAKHAKAHANCATCRKAIRHCVNQLRHRFLIPQLSSELLAIAARFRFWEFILKYHDSESIARRAALRILLSRAKRRLGRTVRGLLEPR